MPSVIEITNGPQHDSFINQNQRAMIFFGSERCGHCREMGPVYEQLARAYPSVAFAHVEVSRVKTENIDGVPVFVGYSNGAYVDMVLGAQRRELLSLITKL